MHFLLSTIPLKSFSDVLNVFLDTLEHKSHGVVKLSVDILITNEPVAIYRLVSVVDKAVVIGGSRARV